MADSKKKQTKVYLIPESESRDSHTYHYLAVKTKKLVIENQKLRLKKFNPAKQIHEWFVEAKLPPHSNNTFISFVARFHPDAFLNMS